MSRALWRIAFLAAVIVTAAGAGLFLLGLYARFGELR